MYSGVIGYSITITTTRSTSRSIIVVESRIHSLALFFIHRILIPHDSERSVFFLRHTFNSNFIFFASLIGTEKLDRQSDVVELGSC